MPSRLIILLLFLSPVVLPLDIAINPRPSGFNVTQFIVDLDQDISSFWRTYKYNLMLTKPFLFYRGTGHLWWRDWINNPALASFGSEKTLTWIQGDLHVDNFGTFDDAAGRVIYEVSDYMTSGGWRHALFLSVKKSVSQNPTRRKPFTSLPSNTDAPFRLFMAMTRAIPSRCTLMSRQRLAC